MVYIRENTPLVIVVWGKIGNFSSTIHQTDYWSMAIGCSIYLGRVERVFVRGYKFTEKDIPRPTSFRRYEVCFEFFFTPNLSLSLSPPLFLSLFHSSSLCLSVYFSTCFDDSVCFSLSLSVSLYL